MYNTMQLHTGQYEMNKQYNNKTTASKEMFYKKYHTMS